MDYRAPYKWSKRVLDGFWTFIVRIKYPKVALLAVVILLAYFTFKNDHVQSFFDSIGEYGYVSMFIGGMLFAFGFGAPFGVAILVSIAGDVNIFLGALVAGVGALVTDYALFKLIRVSFDDEIQRFKNSRTFAMFDNGLLKKIPPRIVYYLGLGIAGLVIASPLPDEFGVALLATFATVKERVFAVISYSLNTIGVFVILEVASVA